MSVPKSPTKRRWSVEFKLQVLSRMDEAASVTLLAEEIGIDREILYVWRRKYRSGGAGALSTLGRPSNLSRLSEVPPSEPSPDGLEAKQRRIEELERKIGQQQLELDFFRAALRHVREPRRTSGAAGETPSTR
jgi:transposase-like protein